MVAARRSQRAGLLSGGEQQAVAIARALAANPRVLLMDEVSLGLAPAVVDGFYRLLPRIQESGVCILLVEQDIDRALAASDRALCLLEGRVVMAGDSAGLDRDRLVSAYFGAPSALDPPQRKPPGRPCLPMSRRPRLTGRLRGDVAQRHPAGDFPRRRVRAHRGRAVSHVRGDAAGQPGPR